MLTSVSIRETVAVFTETVFPAVSTSARLGNHPFVREATNKPMEMAMAVVHRKYSNVFQPMEPTFLMSFMDKIPHMMDRRTMGQMTNFRRFRKMVPKGLM